MLEDSSKEINTWRWCEMSGAPH